MPVRDVLQIGHPVLMAPADPVTPAKITSPEVQAWIRDLIDTMRACNGAGIAANQIGIPYRLFVAEVTKNPRYPYKPPIPLTIVINPEIEFLSDATFTNNEGCLSVPNLRGDVERHLEIRLSGYDERGQRFERDIRGYSAGTFQHEADHLDGILFPHRVADPRTFSSWTVFAEFQQPAFATRVQELVAQWGQ
ncbi:MAG: peptide deformylase [Burkholderiaceae bacterium]